MKVALLGYGRMGKMIEGLCPQLGIDVAGWVDQPGDPLPRDFDVAIDFTEPSAVLGNVQRIAALGKDLVIGTTGWQDQMPEVLSTVQRAGIGVVHSANFSIGVNIFLKLVEDAARLMKDRPEYEAWAYEIHHSAKKDAPSGTLNLAVQAMREGDYSGPIDVASNRAGRVPGTHIIGFDSDADTLTLQHVARNREGFARGALLAAKLVQGRKGLHSFQELLSAGP